MSTESRDGAAGAAEILDGNEAVARTAYRMSEVIAICPITPASGMAELCDQWASEHRGNLWGTVPDVIEPTGPDVVGPTVAPDDPDISPHERPGEAVDIAALLT